MSTRKKQKIVQWLGIFGAIASVIGLIFMLVQKDSALSHTNVKKITIGNNNKNTVVGNKNTVNVTEINYLQTPKITPENRKSILGDYVGNYNSIKAYDILTNDEGENFFILLFSDDPKGRIWNFHSVKFREGRWQASWKTSFNSMPFRVGESKFYKHGNFSIYIGCYPHSCIDSWGILMYDTKNDIGFTAIAPDGYNKNGKIEFPGGLPQNKEDLSSFELALYKYIVNLHRVDSEYYNLKDIFSSTSGRIVLELPPNRDLLNIADYVPKSIKNKISDLLGQEITKNGKVEFAYFLADFDGDTEPEWLVVKEFWELWNEKDKLYKKKYIKLYVIDSIFEKMKPTLLYDSNYAEPTYFHIFGQVSGPPYIIISIYHGASSNFSSVLIFQYDGNISREIKDKKLITLFREEYNIYGNLEHRNMTEAEIKKIYKYYINVSA